MSDAFYVYILATRKDGPLYVGVTNDLHRRVYEHKTHAIKGFTARYNIDRLVYSRPSRIRKPPLLARNSLRIGIAPGRSH